MLERDHGERRACCVAALVALFRPSAGKGLCLVVDGEDSVAER